MIIKDIYGEVIIDQPLVKLIQSPGLKRLKRVWTGGITKFFRTKGRDFSRFNHSVGVLLLLIKYGAGVKEQIAGLFHDVSHTAFSHVTEHLFNGMGTRDSYQDEIHEWFLKEMKIDELLKECGFSAEEILYVNNPEFQRLEQPLPDICADRFDYNLREAYFTKYIDKRGLKRIIDALKFEEGKWFFIDEKAATDFALIPLTLMQNNWASVDGMLSYRWLAQALKLGVDSEIITLKDVHFSYDAAILRKLKASANPRIYQYFDQIKNPTKYYELSNSNNYDQVLKGKFRGIDPLVKIDGALVRLSDVNSDFKLNFEKVKNLINEGFYIKFTHNTATI